MNKFKSGDKVKIVSCASHFWWYSRMVGKVYTLYHKNTHGWSLEEISCASEDYYIFSENDLELVKREPLILEEHPLESYPDKDGEYSLSHYNNYYILTEEDIEAGQIKVDAYWVAKQWKTGSRDDSGALWHSLKTIARFGDKNSVDREIKALYNQAKALARIYKVDLE